MSEPVAPVDVAAPQQKAGDSPGLPPHVVEAMRDLGADPEWTALTPAAQLQALADRVGPPVDRTIPVRAVAPLMGCVVEMLRATQNTRAPGINPVVVAAYDLAATAMGWPAAAAILRMDDQFVKLSVRPAV